MSDPNETANLVGKILQTYREHAAEGAEAQAEEKIADPPGEDLDCE